MFSHTMYPIAFLTFSPAEPKQPFGNVGQIMSLNGEVIMSALTGRDSLNLKNIAVEC